MRTNSVGLYFWVLVEQADNYLISRAAKLRLYSRHPTILFLLLTALGVPSFASSYVFRQPAAGVQPVVATACSLPWGGQLNSGGTTLAYQSSSSTTGSCVSETRSCFNTALSGSYAYASCDVLAPAWSMQNLPSVTQPFTDTYLSTFATTDIVLTLKNTGTGTGTLALPPFGGANAADFSASTSCSTVAPNATCAVTIRFKPTALGARSADLTLAGTTYTFNGNGRALGIVNTNGAYTWADGSLASTCNAYLQGDASHTYTNTGSGIYRLNYGGVAQNVYCDMTTDGGGWTQVLIGNTTGSGDIWSSQLLVKGNALKTYSSTPAARPSLANGSINTFNQLLFKGGSTTWTNRMGTWIHLSTLPAGTTSMSTTYAGALTSNGTTAVYHSSKGWAGSSVNVATLAFDLWDAAGVSSICGGANTPGGKNCPTSNVSNTNYSYHYDGSSAREIFLR